MYFDGIATFFYGRFKRCRYCLEFSTPSFFQTSNVKAHKVLKGFADKHKIYLSAYPKHAIRLAKRSLFATMPQTFAGKFGNSRICYNALER